MGKAGKHLKSALHSQQSRLKAKLKVSHAAQITEQNAQKSGKKTGGKCNFKRKATVHGSPSRRPTIPFKPTHKILLVGEGNFSFARALVENPPIELQFLPPGNVTATAYDSEEECYQKYSDAQVIVAHLREKGVHILFGVDATRLEKTPALKGRRWDRIVWNFPHAGKGITDQDRNILSNQLLILNFLRSVAKMMVLGPIPSFIVSRKKKKHDEEDEDDADDPGVGPSTADESGLAVDEDEQQARGTVLITLRNTIPYTQWDLPRLAKNPPPPTSGSSAPYTKYTLIRSFQFHRDLWQGYEHRMTKGERAHGAGKAGEGGEDRTWEFCLKDLE